jgi:hypothetical protein
MTPAAFFNQTHSLPHLSAKWYSSPFDPVCSGPLGRQNKQRIITSASCPKSGHRVRSNPDELRLDRKGRGTGVHEQLRTGINGAFALAHGRLACIRVVHVLRRPCVARCREIQRRPEKQFDVPGNKKTPGRDNALISSKFRYRKTDSFQIAKQTLDFIRTRAIVDGWS